MGKLSKDGANYFTDAFAIAFPKLTKAGSFEDKGTKKYSLQLLVPKSNKTAIKEITDFATAAIDADTKKTAKEKADAKKRSLKNKDDDYFLFKDGDNKDTEKYPFFAGHYVVNVKRTESWGKPQVVYPDTTPIPDGMIDNEIYGGVVVKVKLQAYFFTAGAKSGVSLQLAAVQKVRDGESHKPEAGFDEIESEDFDFDRDDNDV
jgi:hypothetical protein